MVKKPDAKANTRDSTGVEKSCVESTEEQDKQLESWINKTYSVNEFDKAKNKNEDYSIIFNNCYDFVDDVNRQLNEIKKNQQ